jgi:predicted transcriptional regulator
VVVVGVALEPEQIRRVDRLAARDRRSRSFLIREALAAMLAKAEPQAITR